MLLPFALAAVLVPLLVWRLSRGPAPIRTSDILRDGMPGEAEVMDVRNMGSLFDARPMVRFSLRVHPADPDAGGPFDLEVVQSVPRQMVSGFKAGHRVGVRYTADRSAGAVVLG